MTRRQTFWRILVPQMWVYALPGLSNLWMVLIKATPLLFLLNPTKVEQVLRVADSGEIMPHKSTFFYPKILTGLLIRKLDEAVPLP